MVIGPVKAHVRAAANDIAPRFGITTIHGFGTGSVPNSDHPKGLALDFMTKSKSNGDALAAYVVANASRLSVSYLIWWRRIWDPSRGWHAYTGFNPHTDHVHVSFKPVASGKSGFGEMVPPMVGVPNVDLAAAVKLVTDPHTYLRLLVFAIGAIAIFILAYQLAKPGIQETVKQVTG